VRLIIREDLQNDEDLEIYASVVKLTSLRLLMTIAATRDLELEDMNIKTAFLQASLSEDQKVYMHISSLSNLSSIDTSSLNTNDQANNQRIQSIMNTANSESVWKLQKALYDLKQTSEAWNSEIHNILVNAGFRRSEHDESLYIRQNKNEEICYILLYVDNLLLVAEKLSIMKYVKRLLSSKYDMKNVESVE
jgi:hypothetical protein